MFSPTAFQKLFTPTLVLLDINVDSAAQVAQIRARRKGLIAFLMTLIGLGEVYDYHIDGEGWNKTTTSTSSESRIYIPWLHVSQCAFSIEKPLIYLIVGIIGLLVGLPMVLVPGIKEAGLGMLAMGAIFLVYYFALAKKKTSVGIVPDGGEHQTILAVATTNQLEWMKELYELVQTLARQSGGEGGAPARSSPRRAPAHAPAEDLEAAPRRAPAPAPAASAEPKVYNCPHCNARMRVPATAAGKRATCPSCQQQFQLT
jgi:hypothetical protein